MRPTSQHPHRRVTIASHNTMDNQPNRPTYPETTPVHTDDRANSPSPGPPCDDHPAKEHTTVNRAPGCATSAPATPRAHHAHRPSNASPNSVTTLTPLRKSHHHHTRALPSPEDPNASEPYSFAQGGSRGNRGWPGHRHPKTATPRAVPRDTEAQTPPTTCLAYRPEANLPNPRTSQTNPNPLPKPLPYRPRLTRHLLNLHSSTPNPSLRPLCQTQASPS